MNSISLWYIAIFVINMALSVAAIIGFRYGMAALIGVHAKDELDNADNFAFGITIAGGVLALALIMSAAISGEAQASLSQEFVGILSYAVLGIVLLKIGLLIQDKLLLRGLDVKQEIKSGNVAAAIVSAANIVAVGLIIRSAISWIEVSGLIGLVPVAIVFVASQAILACVTFLRIKVFASRNEGGCWQEAIGEKNTALALRFAGQIIATALVLTAVGNLVEFTLSQFVMLAVTWFAIGFVLMLVVWLIYRALLPVILTKIDVAEEVDRQGNIGVASIEAAIFLGIAALLAGFLA